MITTLHLVYRMGPTLVLYCFICLSTIKSVNCSVCWWLVNFQSSNFLFRLWTVAIWPKFGIWFTSYQHHQKLSILISHGSVSNLSGSLRSQQTRQHRDLPNFHPVDLAHFYPLGSLYVQLVRTSDEVMVVVRPRKVSITLIGRRVCPWLISPGPRGETRAGTRFIIT